MYSYDGAVMAGIDFEKIKISKDDEKKVITVDIPHSRVHTVTVDKDTFKTYSEKESLWNPLKLEDYNMSMAEFEEAAKEKALENGILERSDEQAQKIVDNFISNFPSSKGYEIRYEWRNDNENSSTRGKVHGKSAGRRLSLSCPARSGSVRMHRLGEKRIRWLCDNGDSRP